MRIALPLYGLPDVPLKPNLETTIYDYLWYFLVLEIAAPVGLLLDLSKIGSGYKLNWFAHLLQLQHPERKKEAVHQ